MVALSLLPSWAQSLAMNKDEFLEWYCDACDSHMLYSRPYYWFRHSLGVAIGFRYAYSL